jgi:hypothetical protein
MDPEHHLTPRRPAFLLRAALVILLGATLPSTARAGSGYSCFPKPPDQCRHFSVFELSQTWRLTDPRSVNYAGKSGDPVNFFAVGHMVNADANWALGGEITLGNGSGESARVGVHVRYRRWITDTVTVDVAPGVMIAGAEGFDFPGLTTHASFMVGDVIGVLTVFEVSPIHGEKADLGLYTGVQLGSRLAVLVGRLLALIGSIHND